MKLRIGKKLIIFAVTLLILLGILNLGFTIYRMPDRTMEATISKGERVFVNKFAFGDYFLGIKLPGFSKIERGDIVYFIDPSQHNRPLYQRDRIIGRVVACPYDYFSLRQRSVYINNEIFEDPPTVQHGHRVVPKEGVKLDSAWFDKYDLHDPVNEGKRSSLHEKYYKIYNFEELPMDVWEVPMTFEKSRIVENDTLISYVRFIRSSIPGRYQKIWPYGTYWMWNIWNTTPDFQVPGKGMNITVTFRTLEGYDELISRYEKNKLDVTINNDIYINGKITNSYLVKGNYYIILSDNRDRFYDTRSWGLVPEDYIIGKVLGKK